MNQVPEKDHTKQYTLVGILIALVVAALIIWNHIPKDTNITAATVGEEDFAVYEVNYYYAQAYNQAWQMAQMYQQFGIEGGYDTSIPPAEQMYDEANGVTYADYFQKSALEALQQTALLLDQAKQEGVTLSDEGKQSVKDNLASLDNQILQMMVTQGGSEEYYIQAMYGKTMTKKLLTEVLTDVTLASEYAEAKGESFSYEESVLDAHYQENKNALDSYDYKTFYVPAELPEKGTDEEGNPIEATEEETTAAMRLASASANAMANAVRAGGDFNSTAQEYAPETDKAKYDEPDYSLQKDAQGSSLSGVSATWLQDEKRTAGEIAVVEDPSRGYYVLQFLAREKRETSLETLDVHSIVILAESTESTNEETGEVTSAPSEEQLAAAKTQADDLLKTAPKTAEDFQKLATAEMKSESEAKLTRGVYGGDFDKWGFVPEGVKVGDSIVVPYTDAQTGQHLGYRLVFVNGLGQARWRSASESALRERDYQAWYDGLLESYPIVEHEEGMKLIAQ